MKNGFSNAADSRSPWPPGGKSWHRNGELHREDGPAREWPNGDKEWWVNGKRHREDGPAIDMADGFKVWYRNGQLHRVDGPAVIFANGGEQWWCNGQLHRQDGPAVTFPDGAHQWWLDGTRVTAGDVATLLDSSERETREQKERLITSESAVMTTGLPHPIAPLRPIRFRK